MKSGIYSIYDKAADLYLNPWIAGSPGLANRTFTDEVNRNAEQNNLYHHPDDFLLCQLGYIDQKTGIIEAFPDPQLVTKASDVHNPIQ